MLELNPENMIKFEHLNVHSFGGLTITLVPEVLNCLQVLIKTKISNQSCKIAAKKVINWSKLFKKKLNLQMSLN